jgi:hypothetical protein
MPYALDDGCLVDRQGIEPCPDALKGRDDTITPAIRDVT